MPSFDDLIAARKSAPPKSKLVTVLVDVDVADELAELETQYDAKVNDPNARLARDSGAKRLKAQIDELKAEAAASVVTLKFTAMPGDEWATIAALTSPRPGVMVDVYAGCNVTEAVKLAAPAMGRRIEDGVEYVIDPDPWAVLFTLPGFSDIEDAVFELQVYGPKERLAAAKKALRADS